MCESIMALQIIKTQLLRSRPSMQAMSLCCIHQADKWTSADHEHFFSSPIIKCFIQQLKLSWTQSWKHR